MQNSLFIIKHYHNIRGDDGGGTARQGLGMHEGARPANISSSGQGRSSSKQGNTNSLLFSPIRTVTVGSGVSPDLLTLLKQQALAGLFDRIKITAGGEFHPALRIQAMTIVQL